MTHENYNFALRLFNHKTNSIIGFSTIIALSSLKLRLKSKVPKLTFSTNPIILLNRENEKVPLRIYQGAQLLQQLSTHPVQGKDKKAPFSLC